MTVYGIDLGTTNSLIGVNGKLLTGLVPSVANLKTKEAGERERLNVDANRSFKVDMSMSREGKLSIMSSALVLKELVRLAKEQGHDVKEVVISVPAYFNESQRSATKKAAELLKLTVRDIINEPTAAAIAIGKKIKGLWTVWDLGGGTFDISIIDSRFGNYDVQGTDGIRIGGDDLDTAIRDYVMNKASIQPHKMTKEQRINLKLVSEEAKKHISNTKTDYTFDLSDYPTKNGEDNFVLTVRMYERIMRSTFSETVVKSKELINKVIPDGEDYNLILVGGSSRCPFLQQYVQESLNKQSVEVDYNPDTIVAEGCSIFANMVENEEHEFLVSDITKAMCIELEDGSSLTIIPHNSKIPIKEEIVVTNDKECDCLRLSLFQGESVIAKNNEFIGQLIYGLSRMYQPGELSVYVSVEVTSSGLVKLSAREPLNSPKEITIDRSTD